MASYRLKGNYRDPTTREWHGPGDVVDLDEAEAHRLRYMLADPTEPAQPATSDVEAETPVEPAPRPRARKRT